MNKSLRIAFVAVLALVQHATVVYAADWYVSSTAYAAVSTWASGTSYTSASFVRQTAPAAGNERVFQAGGSCTSGGSEPAWNLSFGNTTTDNTCTWTQITGLSTKQQNGGVTNTWTAPAARLSFAAGAGANFACGDRIFVSSDHDETAAAITVVTFKSGCLASTPTLVLSVNRTTGNIPPLAADITSGATVETTGANALQVTGQVTYIQGLTFKAGSGASAANLLLGGTAINPVSIYLKNSKLILNNSSSSSVIGFGTATASPGEVVYLDNTTVQFGSISQTISTLNNSGRLEWINTPNAVAGVTFPTNLFTTLGATTQMMEVVVRGVDLSALVSGKFIFAVPNTGQAFTGILSDCKLSASLGGVVNTGSTPMGWGSRVDMINCDSGNTGYRNEWYRLTGSIKTSASTFRNGGASDGVADVSHLFSTGAQASTAFPLVGPDLYIWSTFTSGSHTATVPIVSSASHLNTDIWMRCEYLGTTGFPLSVFADDGAATLLTTGSAQPTDSTSVWTSPPATPVYQSLQVTYSPTLAGLMHCNVMDAKTSDTVYVDPLIQLQ